MLSERTYSIRREAPYHHPRTLQGCLIELLLSKTSERNRYDVFSRTDSWKRRHPHEMLMHLGHNPNDIEALCDQLKILICVITISKLNNQNRASLEVYGQKLPTTTEYSCILNDTIKSDCCLLYAEEQQNPNKNIEKFERTDQTARKILEDFINDQYQCNLNIIV